jgi:ATP-binding cassette, subfamily B, bacterial MsbA
VDEYIKFGKEFSVRILKPYRYMVILLVVVSLIASLLDGLSAGMLVPLLTSLQPDQHIEKLPNVLKAIAGVFSKFPLEKQLILSTIAVVVAVLLKNVFLAISFYLGTWLSSRVSANLRAEGIDLLMNVGMAFYNKSRAGDLGQRLLGSPAKIEAMVIQVTKFLANLASFIVLFVILVVFSWRLTLLTVICTILIAKAVSYYIKLLANEGEKSATLSRDLSTLFYESINGIQLIKAFVKEHVQASLFKEKIEKYRTVNQHINFRTNLIHIITECLGLIAIAIIFFTAISIYNFDTGIIITQLVPFMYILTRIMPTVKTLNQTRSTIALNMPFAKLIFDLLRLDDKPFIKSGSKIFHSLRHGIQFKSVTFSYGDDESNALVNASFEITKGKTTAIVGESGAGKSTIVNLLLRFYEPERGFIIIDGEQAENYQIESYRGKIGMVSQDTFIFNDTVRNNIAFGAEDEPGEDLIIESAKKASAHDFIMNLPEGYNTTLGDRGVRLSGGQRQRISIARAILKDPEILILDEATSSLDAMTEKLIHDAIYNLSQGRTVLIIAHRLSTIKNADKIIVLKKGRVVEMGNEMQLVNKRGEYHKIASSHL